MRHSLLAFLAVGALAGVLWLAARIGGDSAGSAQEGARPAALAPPTANASAAAEKGAASAPAAAGESLGRRYAASPVAAGYPSARAVPLRIELPLGAPPDPEARVIAIATRGGALAPGPAPFDSTWAAAWLAAAERAGFAHIALPLAPDRTLELPLPESGDLVLLVDARFLFLREPVRVAADVDEVLLRPQLGGALELVGLPPEVAAAQVELSALDRDLVGFSFGPGLPLRRERWEGVTPLVLGGLDPLKSFTLLVDPQTRVPWRAENLVVEPGRLARLPVSFTRGASVTGRVLLPGGEPAAGATVRVRPAGEMERFFYGRPREGVAAPDGTFALVGIRPAKVKIIAELAAYRPATSAELTLADGTVLEGLELTLEAGAVLAGRVLLANGEPAAGASVWVRGGPRSSFWPNLEHTRTDGQGRFRVGGLEEDEYTLIATRVDAPGEVDEAELPGMFARMIDDDPKGSRTLRRMRELAAEMSGPGALRAELEGVRPPREDLELRLAPPPGLVGRVIGPDGEPLARYRVSARPAEQRFGPRVNPSVEVDDPAGRFVLSGLFPGEWQITVEAAGFVQTPAPLEVRVPHEGELRIELDRGAFLSGVVLDPSGRPIEKAVVSIERGERGGGGFFMGPRFGVLRREARTDEAGRFRLGELPAGAGRLVARHQEWAPSEPLPFDLAPGEGRDGLELTLRRGGTLVGEVFDKHGRPQSGRPIHVMRMDESGQPRQTTSDADGRFRLEHLAPGMVQVMAQPGREAIEGALGGEERPGPLEFMKLLEMESAEIVEGETTTVVLGAPPRAPVRVFGVVTRAGQPLSGGTVLALPEGRGLLAGMEPARIESDGRYELVLEEPGDVVFVVSRGEFDFGGFEFHETVPEVEALRLDLELPGGRIAGRILGPAGEPLSGQRVRLRRSHGPPSIGSLGSRSAIRSGADGSFVLEDLAAGRYVLEAGGGVTNGVRYGTRVLGDLLLEEDGALEGIEIELPRAGALAGVVVGQDGSAVRGASVYVRDAGGLPLAGAFGVQTDDSGRFLVEGLAPGEVTVGARAGSRAAREVGPLLVREGAPSEVELVLEEGTVLRVIAEDGEGRPLRATVSVRDEAGRELSGIVSPEAMRDLFANGISSRERRVGPLAPGRYVVTVTHPDGRVEDRTVRLVGRPERIVRIRFRDES